MTQAPVTDEREAGNDAGGQSAKQTTSGSRSQSNKHSGVRYLSDFITEVPTVRRVKFIAHLKDMIRASSFDGGPLSDTFELTYIGRGKDGPEERTSDQRDFVVDDSPAFQEWLSQQLTVPQRSPFASREQLEAGQVSLAEVASKYRRRAGATGKRKAKR